MRICFSIIWGYIVAQAAGGMEKKGTSKGGGNNRKTGVERRAAK